MKKKPTMQDVANLAKLSKTLVARYVNNQAGVSQHNKIKIANAIKILGYRKNLIATQLKKSNNNLVGVFIFDISSNIYINIFNGIQAEADKNKINLLTGISNFTGKYDSQIIENMIDSDVKGILMIGSSVPDKKLQEYNKVCPIVTLTRNVPKVSSVFSDPYQGIKKITDYLISQNCKNIVYISPAKDFMTKSRIDAYKQLMKELDLPNNHYCVENDPVKISNMTKNLLLSDNPPDAIMAFNDFYALGCFDAIKKIQPKLNKTVYLTGYDNIYISELSPFKLTTIEQKSYTLGITGLQLLLEKIKFPQTKCKKIVLSPTLIRRQSKLQY